MCVCVCVRPGYLSVFSRTDKHKKPGTNTHAHKHINTHTLTNTHTQIQTDTHTYIRTYKQTHTRTNNLPIDLKWLYDDIITKDLDNDSTEINVHDTVAIWRDQLKMNRMISIKLSFYDRLLVDTTCYLAADGITDVCQWRIIIVLQVSLLYT